MNPIFARAAKQRSPQRSPHTVVTVDLTTTVPPERAQLRCPITSALAPVHILQGSDSIKPSKFCPTLSVSNGRTSSPCQQAASSIHSESRFLGSLLQREDQTALENLRRQEIVDAGIASRSYHRHSEMLLPGEQPPTTVFRQHREAVAGNDLQTDPADMKSLRFCSYMHQLMKCMHGDRSQCGPAAEQRWSEQLEDMQARGRRLASQQLPWAHKYAPVESSRVLENEDASQELLMWLKQVEPMDAVLTSMRSGQLYARPSPCRLSSRMFLSCNDRSKLEQTLTRLA